MDLEKVRGFIAFAKALNFTQAARAANISQPALFAQVRQLEAELGVPLYYKEAGQLQLTEYGRDLLLFGQNLLDEVAEFKAKLRGVVERRPLRVGAGLTATLYLLPNFLRVFRASAPEAECRVVVRHRGSVMDMLRRAELELGITSVEQLPADMAGVICARARHALIVPRAHALARARKITLERIARYGLIVPPLGFEQRRLIDSIFESSGVPFQVALETEGWEVIKHYVALGFGIAIVNDLCLTQNVPAELHVRHLAELFPEKIYRVVWCQGRRLPDTAQAFLKCIK
ncbi:MAG: LysR family transcriptional regulator [Acidobacteriota bacterium]